MTITDEQITYFLENTDEIVAVIAACKKAAPEVLLHAKEMANKTKEEQKQYTINIIRKYLEE